jgi:hypothetical protein
MEMFSSNDVKSRSLYWSSQKKREEKRGKEGNEGEEGVPQLLGWWPSVPCAMLPFPQRWSEAKFVSRFREMGIRRRNSEGWGTSRARGVRNSEGGRV